MREALPDIINPDERAAAESTIIKLKAMNGRTFAAFAISLNGGGLF